jgi:dihydrolipoamide dehydrogenase
VARGDETTTDGGSAFDLVVIGAGPGGYVAAIRAAQLGLRTACVEKEPALGGVCLNVGCIPSKALLTSSEHFEHASKHLAEHGVVVDGVRVDLPAMMKRKDKVVTVLTRGIAGLFKKYGVTSIQGTARIPRPGAVAVTGPDGSVRELAAKRILVATGSAPIELQGLPFDGRRVVDSTAALALPAVPSTLVVVGAGAIGLELGSVWRRLGSKVTVIELTSGCVPGMDREVAKLLERALRAQGLAFRFETKVESARVGDAGVSLSLVGPDGARSEIEAEVVLVAVGRRPRSEGIGLEDLGVAKDARGRVIVDDRYETNVKGIFAVGDLVPGPMLAHKAEEEGVACVESMAGGAGHVDHALVPAVVYTEPEAAGVGLTEEQCAERGLDVRIGRVPLVANARARTMAATEGAVKIIADARTDRILGAHVVGAQASNLVAELALAMAFGASSEDVARTCHAHPTLPEAVKEAALAVAGRTINL